MQRFFVPEELSGYIPSEHPLYHQLTRVLRSRVSDMFAICHGDEIDQLCRISSIDKRGLLYDVAGSLDRGTATPICSITLFQSLPNKSEKLEYLIQKGVESGVKRFVFFSSRYTQLSHLDLRKKDRYERIAQEALEQCGRGDRIILEWYDDLTSVLPQMLDMDRCFVTSTREAIPLSHLRFTPEESYGVFVGPEGGWSHEELELFAQKKVEAISFGTRILRTETVSSVFPFYILNHSSLSSI